MAKDELAEMLERADPESMQNDPIIRQAFTVALLASDLFVPVEQTEDEQTQAGGVSLQAVEIDGHPHVLLFSSQEKLGAFMGTGTRFARASGNAVLPSLRGSHAILNPGEKGRVFAPDDIAEILGEAPECGHEGHVHGPGCSHDH
jgi:hypothetical protein